VVRVVVLGSLACLPDRELASYAAGRAVASDSVASAEAPAPAPSVADPLGAVADSPRLETSRDAGATPPDVTSPVERDATPARTLACRTDCDCERQDERDFMFCPETVSFADAEERCADAGGTLASIDDAALNDWLTQQMQARSADDFWLSGTDAEDEGIWRWADGRVFFPPPADAGESFVPWDAQQPNDLNGEDCMRSVGGVWRDLSCDLELAYICQG
jgi:CUB/sushi domain-containing protein